MLDNETKRRIDSARDILVGKVPDPKSQVEQITIALIYKFMDDMDKEAVELGGEATFFTGENAKYSWTKIFDPKLGGHEMLNLYGEAIVKLNLNANLPQLFRDIFKNAYLPYRDPETLKLFLKTINDFEYDHSERLGDAFEYLLSVLGSQGDAGQFRTPRHIIDFVVKVLQPKKNETICDPACGTAGFLISSYKYILDQNQKKTKGDLLTPDEKRKLMQHFTGYDISPDMVRLSLVNMYLHNFTAPRIYEYDTLTSEDRWGDSFDVILANPPFMTPKGGIKPHKKFSLKANRSEVLFVDYIAEHINPTTGRAGVIVPEGIIFQSGTAYKTLRKMLVDKHYLYAVVSLPAGVFQPYSSVKTSILLMDKTIARKSDEILFVKIEADGFDLGAQRKPIDNNDLPKALDMLLRYKEAVLNGAAFSFDDKNVLVISKEKIIGNADHNLSFDRYRASENIKNTNFETARIGDVCDLMTGGTPKSTVKEFYEGGAIKWLVSGDIHKGEIFDCEGRITEEGLKNSNAKFLPVNSVLIALNGQGKTRGTVAILRTEATCNQSLVSINPKNKQQLLTEFLYYTLKSQYQTIRNLTGDEERSGLNMPLIRELKIPLPPISIQREIVAKIESCQRIINGAKQVVENYKPHFDIDPEWATDLLGKHIQIDNGKVLTEFEEDGNTACIKVSDMNLEDNQEEITTTSHWIKDKVKNLLPIGTIVFPKRGAAIATNKKRITAIPCVIDNNCMALIVNSDKLSNKFLFYYLQTFDLRTISNSAGVALINNSDISGVQIPLPEMEIQIQIVNRLQLERKLINANKELIKIYEQRIKDEINKLWQDDGKDNSAEKELEIAIEA